MVVYECRVFVRSFVWSLDPVRRRSAVSRKSHMHRRRIYGLLTALTGAGRQGYNGI